jgi:hypothetical protein
MTIVIWIINAWADRTFAGNVECDYDQNKYGIDPYWQATLPILLYPSGAANNDSSDPHGNSYPYDYQWGTWALLFNGSTSHSCPLSVDNPSGSQPNTASFGLFAPLDPNNLNTLGAYRLWFFNRKHFTVNPYTGVQPCYDGSC